MRSIQIAPYREDCRIVGKKVTGTMGGRTFVFEVPERYAMPRTKVERATMIDNFREAIALCSKPRQIERLLNDHWQIEGGRFYEK